MHMADALIAPAVGAVMYAASASVAGLSIYKTKKEELIDRSSTPVKKLPTMAVMSAMVFAGQMINFTIPGTGSSGHLCGGMLLSAVLGPWAGFLSMIAVLTIQCLFFADGGLLALGANIWNMAFYGCFVGYFLIYRPIMNGKLFSSKGDKTATRIKITLASVAGCMLTLQLGAFSVVLETLLSGITEIPFAQFAALMQPIHLAIGLVEGLITSAVLIFVYESRPEILREVNTENTQANGRLSFKTTIAVLTVCTLVIGGGISLLASSNPDGLEWALFGNSDGGYNDNLGLDEENYGITDNAHDKAGEIVDKTAFMPDYDYKTAGEEGSATGTTTAGIVGAAMVALVAGVLAIPVKKKKTKSEC